METSNFHAEATSPCVDAAGGDCDLISSALEIFSVEPARVNVREHGAFRHTGTARDLAWRKVLLNDDEGKDDLDQFGARLTGKRLLDLVSTFC